MGKKLKSLLTASLLTVLLLVSVPAASADELGYTVESAKLTVYRDGVVHAAQSLSVNETFPAISLRLLASSVENVMVLDENGTVLDYDLDGANMTVYSLGATQVRLEYDTASLTAKKAGVWTLHFENPYNLTVYLPEGSTILYISDVPDLIETENGKIVLSLFPGPWEISYALPIVPPAAFRITGLSVEPSEVELGKEVTVSVNVANIGEAEGSYTVVLKVDGATEETKTVTLAGGTSTTVEFKVTKKTPGVYSVEVAGLKDEFKVKEPPLAPFPLEYLLAAAVAFAVVFAGFMLLKRRTPSAEKIFKKHPYLRDEDKAVIKFLAEKGGKALEAEIRERFPDLPRTSLWRLVRRLEKMGIVTVKKVGLQNQVNLKKQ